jgi:hypothetical protein
MISVSATPVFGGKIHWYKSGPSPFNEEEGATVVFNLSSWRFPVQKRDALKTVEKAIGEDAVSWIRRSGKRWEIDLDGLAEFAPELKTYPWFKGRVTLEPELEPLGPDDFAGNERHRANLVFYITRETILTAETSMPIPPEIEQSLMKFRSDYPHPSKVAFIMMQFGRSKAHTAIVDSIRNALQNHGITALRADDKDYHDDLFPNILTYVYGCTFGIAVFERLETEQFNPNVSLEVGYMLALQKPVCLLKDSTLRTLNTDLVSKLYKPFDPQDPGASIPEPLLRWCRDRNIL